MRLDASGVSEVVLKSCAELDERRLGAGNTNTSGTGLADSSAPCMFMLGLRLSSEIDSGRLNLFSRRADFSIVFTLRKVRFGEEAPSSEILAPSCSSDGKGVRGGLLTLRASNRERIRARISSSTRRWLGALMLVLLTAEPG